VLMGTLNPTHSLFLNCRNVKIILDLAASWDDGGGSGSHWSYISYHHQYSNT